MTRRWLHALLMAAGLLLALRLLGPHLPLDREHRLLEWFAEARTPALDAAMLTLTWLGSLFVLGPLALLAFFILSRKGWQHEAWLLMTSLAGAALIGRVAKWWVGRPRPDLHAWMGDLPLDFTFPSLHTMQSAVFFLTLAWILKRRIGWAIAMLLVAAIGISRLYLQVHYPSDVLAGYCAAIAWLWAVHSTMKDRHEKQVPRH